MNTYSTYQEAKIANPESEIYENDNGEFGTREQLSEVVGQYVLCEPKDYCITVEKFLADGHKFVDKDLYLGDDGEIKIIGKDVPAGVANNPVSDDDARFALRSAALNQTETPEEKEAFDVMAQGNEVVDLSDAPSGATHYGIHGCNELLFFKYDKGVYLMWKNENWSLSGYVHHEWLNAIPALEQPKHKYTKEEGEWDGEGMPPVGVDFQVYVGGVWLTVKSLGCLVFKDREKYYGVDYTNGEAAYNTYDRPIRKVVTEREAFIEEAKKSSEYHHNLGSDADLVFGDMFDAGCRFNINLVEGE